MDNIENLISTIDVTMDTQRKRHIIGGILLSISMFFGGLAFTVMTLNFKKEIEDE